MTDLHKISKQVLKEALKEKKDVCEPELLKIKSVKDAEPFLNRELRVYLEDRNYIEVIADQGHFRVTQAGKDYVAGVGEKKYRKEKYIQPAIVGIIVALFSSGITYYITKRSSDNETLKSYRKENITKYKERIKVVETLIKEIDELYFRIDRKALVRDKKGNVKTINGSDNENVGILMKKLNKLGTISYELPYQFRLVGGKAKHHYRVLLGKLLTPQLYKEQKLPTENFTYMVFVRNIWRAEQDYILNGEPIFDLDYSVYK